MASNLTTIDLAMIEEAKDGKPLWKHDPYGTIQKRNYIVNTQDDIERVLGRALVGFDPEDPNIAKLPVLGIQGTLKKELDDKYKLKQLEFLDKLDKQIAQKKRGRGRPRKGH